MSFVKEWSSIICITALLGSLVEIIIPPGHMERIARFIFAAFMICTIIISFSKTLKRTPLKLDFDTKTSKISRDMSEEIQGQFKKLSSKEIEGIIADILIKNDIKYKKIDIIMDMNEDLSISIIRISLILSKDNLAKADIAKSIIKENLGLETDISFS